MPRTKLDPIKNFWSKVKGRGTDQCWHWTAYVSPTGYGSFHVNRKRILAHRYSYQLQYGEIPKGYLVMHKCDNPSCVNPNHLMIGTHVDNMRDMAEKNRSAKTNASLTDDDVVTIKGRLSHGERPVEIAKDYPVGRSAVSLIKHGYNWRHVLAIPLFLMLGACGTFADLVEAPETTVPLIYQNPQRPTPIIPFNPTLKTMTEWESKVTAGEIRPSGLVCMTHNDSLSLLAWMVGVSNWQKQALTAIEFHEEQNKPPDE